METIYADISARTGGNIYIGVVGPVRTGKSTLIKRIMEQLVIPNIKDPYRAERARDELPQSGSGKSIMTSEPKFIPENAIDISPDGKTQIRIRMIDTVGYMVDGAVGADEDGNPRMITTPWFDHEIPMTQAAELGTKKVMQEHCSIGLVVTTDGSVTDIPRSDYITAERRAIQDMKATGKPFLVVINTADPNGDAAKRVQSDIAREHGLNAVIADCQTLDYAGISNMLLQLLYAFPMTELRVFLPRWMDALDIDDPIKANLCQALLKCAESIHSLGQAEASLHSISRLEQVQDLMIRKVDLADGSISCCITFPDALFYEILSQKAGIPIENDAQLLSLLAELTAIKREYDQIADALNAAKATGYGIVMPMADQIKLEAPEILRKGSTYGVKLKAGAPSIHMIRVDIDTEISPMVGDEKQSKDLMGYLSEESPEKLWQSNIFGKSVYDLIQEGLSTKLTRTPGDVRDKFRGSLCRIVNEGASGLICLIL